MSKFPFTERHVKGNSFLREFRSSVDSEELVWHQDREDRVVKVVESGGWMLQMDNDLPVLLEEGESYNIPSLSFHRVIKGSGDLKIIVEKKNLISIFEGAVEDISNLGVYNDGSYIVLYDFLGVLGKIRYLDGDQIEPFIKGVVRLGWNSNHKAYKVEEIWAQKGYGPTLYRLAIQYAGDRGLMPSPIRGQVSAAASNVWKEFYDGKGSQFVNVKSKEDGVHDVEHLDAIYFSKGKQIDTSTAEKNHNKIFNKKRDPYEERLTTLLETADSVLREAVSLVEDEEQRKLRAKPEPENLLSVIYKKFNEKWGRPIPYFGSKTVKIYRGISPQAPKTLRPGDWVALKSSYAKEHGGEGSVVVSKEVPAEHVTWAGTDENEWFYTPHESVVESSPESLSEPEKGNVGEQTEPYQKMARKRFEKMMKLTIKGGNKHKTKGMKTIVPKVGKSAPPGE